MRAVRVPFSPARPSRLKNEPGILPAAYMRSSTSTVRAGSPHRGDSDNGGAEHHGVARTDDNCAGGLLGQLAGFERNLLAGDLDAYPRKRRQTYSVPFCSALRSAEFLIAFLFVPNCRKRSGCGLVSGHSGP